MPTFIPPTRAEQRWRATAYLLIAAIGVYALWLPVVFHTSLAWIVYLWGAFVLTAVPAAWAVYHSRYRLEAVLLPLFIAALAVSAVSAVRPLLDGIDQTELTALPRVLTGLALVCLLAVRAHQLHRILKAEPWITTGS
jgi:drug/metabolite transporter (DMT)-like permease